jgi:hypothetical protein
MQFQRYEPEDGKITEKDFGDILLLYAGLNENKRIKMMKRVKKAFKDDPKVNRNSNNLCFDFKFDA